MLKRIVIISLALVLLVGLLLVPASAASVDPDDVPYIELTDYWISPLDGLQPGAFYVSGSYSFVGNFGLTLGEISGYGYEITYSYTGDMPAVTGVSLGGVSNQQHTSRYLDGTNIGKVRGDFKGATGSDVGISFSSSGCYITVHSFKLFLVDNFQVALSASLPDGSYFPGDDMSDLNTFSTINIDNWRNYDFVDLSFTVWTDAISSVSVVLSSNVSDLETVIPFEVSYLNLDNYQGAAKPVGITISCDLRGIDPATTPDSSLLVHLTSNYADGWMQMTSVYGVVVLHSPDQYTSWLKGLSAIGIETNQYLFEFLYDVFPAYLNKLEAYDAAAAQRAMDIIAQVSSLQDTIGTEFEDFKSWYFDLYSQGEKEKWFGWFKPAFQTVFDKFDQLIDGISVSDSQQSAVQESAQGMTSAGSSLSDLGAEMDSYTPSLSVDDINFDATSLVPALGMASAGTLASIVTSDPLVASMLLIVATLALVGFVLFGKR